MITEKLKCLNGDYVLKTDIDTRKENENYKHEEISVTIDSSSNITTKGNSSKYLKDNHNSFKHNVYGKKFSYSIKYDSNWNITSVRFYKNEKKDKSTSF